jgi:hypothetical protein
MNEMQLDLSCDRLTVASARTGCPPGDGWGMTDDSFQLAAKRARHSYPLDVWISLRPREQTAAIYRELRRIDAEQAAAKLTPRRRPERVKVPETADVP